MWSQVNSIPVLKKNQVHTWRVSVIPDQRLWALYFSHLSENEKTRASKFRFEKDRLTYVTARGVLRELISAYTHQSPSAIAFFYNEQSKPYIISDTSLKFNVSHSGEKILMSFSLEHEIGVDVEFNKRSIEIPQVAKSFFSKNETKALLCLPDVQQLSAFYNCWTRKEAFIKAKGGGLSIPLDQFEVSLLPEEKAELRVIKWDQTDVVNWNLQSITVGEDYTGAVIVKNPSALYDYFDWSLSL